MEKNLTIGGRLKGAANYLWREGTVYIILAALILMFSFINPLFFSARNIYNLISESSFLIIAGMGIVFVMISGGMDLSVGYQMAMVSTTSFLLMDSFAKANGGDVPAWFVLEYRLSMEKEMASHSSILAWRIPWTREPGGLL